ncbi:alpha,alpha-trehalase nth1 [Ascosphaera acerosa]|nr:alpha,alpha-trehalase nth1 [Ascosphaera acerosa]
MYSQNGRERPAPAREDAVWVRDRRSSDQDGDPFTDADVYYGMDSSFQSRARRAQSGLLKKFDINDIETLLGHPRHRRSSHDESCQPRRFIIDVERTMNELLAREDTDKNMQITIDDLGPKTFSIGTAQSSGFHRFDVRGTYMVSNLLQELTLARDHGHKVIVLDERRLNENPMDRLTRLCKSAFWKALTRQLDARNIARVGRDPKDWTSHPVPRIYVPRGAPEQYGYYLQYARDHPEDELEVHLLPPQEEITAEYIRDLNMKPGILALDMEAHTNANGETELRGVPYVVPGGRFNEFYGWDSYMMALGLLLSNRVDLVKGIAKNYVFCIQHYGKIPNANRTYYLGRSQPPFLTDAALRLYSHTFNEPDAHELLRRAISAAIKEYYTVWMSAPRYDPETGLSRYHPIGIGVPPETEPSHFYHVLLPYAEKHGLNVQQFTEAYNVGEIKEPALDEFFRHDRAVRESGHDTSYRLESVCADLATVDLNSLLHKYELDIALAIRMYFQDKLEIAPEFRTKENAGRGFETSAIWDRRAKKRQLAMNKYMWNDKEGMFFDYNTAKKCMTTYESVTTFWTMWSGLCTPRQASRMVNEALPKFECYGGLVSGTEKSRGEISILRPSRQWDYPFGWAPQQMLAWTGLVRYGYKDEAQDLAYKWLYMVLKAFVDFNGVVVEKYNVTRQIDPHKVEAEYGNQGSDFKGVSKQGFGWVNASFLVASDIINAHMRRALGTITPFETWQKAMELP